MFYGPGISMLYKILELDHEFSQYITKCPFVKQCVMYLMIELGKETAAQAVVVGSIILMFRKLKNQEVERRPQQRASQRVRPQLFFSLSATSSLYLLCDYLVRGRRDNASYQFWGMGSGSGSD